MTQLSSQARTAVVFNPPADIHVPTSRQIAEAFRFHTTGVNSLTVVAPSEALPWIENYLPDIAVVDPGVLMSNNFESIVFVHPFKDAKFYIPPFEPSGWRSSTHRIRFYAIDANGRLLPAGRKYDDRDAENMDAHIFNRLSKPVGEEFYYFPYGYPGWDPSINLDSGCQTIFQLSKTETRNTNWSCAMGDRPDSACLRSIIKCIPVSWKEA